MHSFPPDNHQTPSTRSLRTGIAELEAIAGRDAALAIIAACAGRDILVRAIPLPHDELSGIVGLDVAQAIADELLGDDEEGRRFFIDQPTYLAKLPGEEVTPQNEPLPAPREGVMQGILGKIEETCGRDVALKVAAHYCGRRLYIPYPDHITDERSAAQIIGVEALQALAEVFPHGSYIDIPPAIYGSTAARREIGKKMLRDGYRPSDVIRLLKVSRSVVFEWSRKIKEEQK